MALPKRSKKAWPEAVAAFRNGLKYSSTSDLAIRLDASLRAGGNVAEADKFMAGWLKDHPKDRDANAYLAEMAIGKKDYAGAAARYKALLEIQPDDALSLNNLAYVSGQLKDPKAVEYAEKANKLMPDNAAIPDTLGMLLVERGDAKRGADVMQSGGARAGLRRHTAQLRAGIDQVGARSRRRRNWRPSRSSATGSRTRPRSAGSCSSSDGTARGSRSLARDDEPGRGACPAAKRETRTR
jgi:tetratricopeptide (TPR) repeat protein